MKLRADFHNHTHYSRDSVMSPQAFIDACLRKGLDCVAVTDHDQIEGAFVVQKLAPFKVIVGEEVKTSEGELIGLFLKELVPRGMSPEDTVRCIHEQGGIVIVPHPFDVFRRSVITRQALERIAPTVDAVEGFNCRNILSRHDAAACDVASRHDKPLSVGSDAHSPWEVGGVHVVMDDFETPAEFIESLRRGEIVGRRSLPMVHWISTYAKVRWRLGLRPTYATGTR
jgi:predicted metal-dependent phosphoesterase TrpH